MSASVTNRVYLPDGRTVYVSDDRAGDDRLEELYVLYGDLTVEACYKVLGTALDDLETFWTGTITSYFN